MAGWSVSGRRGSWRTASSTAASLPLFRPVLIRSALFRPFLIWPVLIWPVLICLAVLAGCTDPPSGSAAAVTSGQVGPPRLVRQVDGIDWSLPDGLDPAPNSGFYSEDAAPAEKILVRSVDLTWRQLAPRAGVLDTAHETGSAQGLSFDPLDTQLLDDGPFWMRIFASGRDWAPTWVAADCRVRDHGPDDDGMRHLPLWNECVWSHLLDTYRDLFVDKGLRADPRLRFVYVPGGYTWAEYDFETMNAAAEVGDLDSRRYLAWHAHAWKDLVEIFGPYATKLVFTGEDHPFTDLAEGQRGQLARQVTAAGMGIRNGIPELSNFHLSQAPAYGSRIGVDGHLTIDESLAIHDGRHVIGMENECFTSCGFRTDDLAYAVTQTNLKSLQLRANWIYVVPGDSGLEALPEHWHWVRLSLGRTASTTPDVWAQLREASDEYWRDNDEAPFTTPASWPGKPWVRNLERWLVQRDVPGGRAYRASVDVRRGVLAPENGTAHEGLSTRVAAGDTAIHLDVDDRFAAAVAARPDSPVQVQITYWDAGGAFRVVTGAGSSATVTPGGTRRWRTAIFRVRADALRDSLAGGTDLAVQAAGRQDVTVWFVRVVRTTAG